MVCFICGAVSHVSKDVHQSDTWWWLYRMIYRMICREVSDLIFFFLFFFTVTNTSAFNSNESTSIDNWIWRFSAAMLRRLSAWIDAGSKFFSDLAHFHWVIGRYRCFHCRLAGRTSKISIVYRPLAIFLGVGGLGVGGEGQVVSWNGLEVNCCRTVAIQREGGKKGTPKTVTWRRPNAPTSLFIADDFTPFLLSHVSSCSTQVFT